MIGCTFIKITLPLLNSILPTKIQTFLTTFKQIAVNTKEFLKHAPLVQFSIINTMTDILNPTPGIILKIFTAVLI